MIRRLSNSVAGDMLSCLLRCSLPARLFSVDMLAGGNGRGGLAVGRCLFVFSFQQARQGLARAVVVGGRQPFRIFEGSAGRAPGGLPPPPTARAATPAP